MITRLRVGTLVLRQGFLVWPPIKRDDFLLVRCRWFTRDGASHPIKANSQAIGVRYWFHFNHLIVLLDLFLLTVSVPSRVYRPTHDTSLTNWRLWWGQSNVLPITSLSLTTPTFGPWRWGSGVLNLDAVSPTKRSCLLEGSDAKTGSWLGSPRRKMSASFKALWSMHQESTQFQQTGRRRRPWKNTNSRVFVEFQIWLVSHDRVNKSAQ